MLIRQKTASHWCKIFCRFSLLVLILFLPACHDHPETASRFPMRDSTLPSPIFIPINQVLTPAGTQVFLPKMRPQVLALCPDGKFLATSGKTHDLVTVDPQSGKILQRVPFPSAQLPDAPAEPVSSHILEPEKEAQVSYTGLVFSPDGSHLFLSSVNGHIKVFAVTPDAKVTPLYSIPLPETGLAHGKTDVPAGLAISSDGKKLYVVLNLSNRLLELNLTTRTVERIFNVGNAPYAVCLCGSKAYVSNWGGRIPDDQSITGPVGIGAFVRVDPARFIANEGSVSVIDLVHGRTVAELQVGLHSSALALSPDRRHLAIANANSDTISVIDTRSDRLIETISLKWHPSDFFGASPNALAFDRSGKTLYVCHGTQNAVGVVAFRPGKSRLIGLIPTGWYPAAIVYDAERRSIHVANIKGGGAPPPDPGNPHQKFNTHQYNGTLSLIPLPRRDRLGRLTAAVQRNYQRSLAQSSLLPPRPGTKPRPVPERVGEPSLFKHVVYIIKENRTYDQVLGDLPQGNGDPSLCIFGEKITPNQHKLCREFALLDNTHCSGILSADGHQWADSAFATDYMEKSFAGFPRSYPDGMEDRDLDALAYSPTGFIWDNVLEHGKTLRDYGEFAVGTAGWADRTKKPGPKFLDYYRDFIDGTGLTRISSRSGIGSLTRYLNTNTIGWDLDVPDVVRAAAFTNELQQFERTGQFPHLTIICLPNDHTSGTKPGHPTPAACLSDNDLAFGQIVEAITRSRFWKETCIFAIEDDPQDGWDHVSGYRTTAYVISPYSRKKIVHERYNQTSLLRTMELILGLPPMNQMDATASPMTACFSDSPDFTPFTAVQNNIPLDQMNPPLKAIHDPIQRKYAVASSKLDFRDADDCPEDVLNRILWHAQKGTSTPYPAWAIESSRAGRSPLR